MKDPINRKKLTNEKTLLAMSYLMNPTDHKKPDPVKTRKVRSKETAPRDMAEKKFELLAFQFLETENLVHGDILVFGKTECSAVYNPKYNFYGFSDAMCFNLKTNILWFIEFKVKDRKLRAKQSTFKDCCDKIGGNVRHIIARQLSDLSIITKREEA